MTTITGKESINLSPAFDTQKSVSKIIALWGFSEATLGGILHALNIPFTGMFVGGVSVLMISFLASLSPQKGIILRSTLIVIMIKGMVSPHTPVTAYFAVLLQGLLGELFFGNIRNRRIAIMIFSFLVMLLASMQKLIILTIVFGNTFWESINIYSNFIINQIITSNKNPELFQLSYLLIALYVGQHLIIGIFVGYIGGRLPHWINEHIKSEEIKYILDNYNEGDARLDTLKKKKHWWRKKSGIVFILILLSMLVISYLYPEMGTGNISKIIIMIVRAVIVIIVWFSLISPYLLRIFMKYLGRKNKSYALEIEGVINTFPQIKHIIKKSWEKSTEFKRFNRLKIFLSTTIVLLLVSDLKQLNENYPGENRLSFNQEQNNE